MFSFIFKNYHNSSDEELMVYMQNGNAKALDELYKRYSKKMLYFFYQKLSQDNEKAQDFLQDLFMKIIEKPELFDTDKKFSTWIYSMAFNMCKNEYRRDAIRGMKVNDYDLNIIENNGQINHLHNQFDKDLFNQHLNSELSKLEENQRMTFILRYKEDLSIKEISEIMDCPEGTIKSRLFYTVQKLSVKLKVFDPYNEIKC